MSAMGHTRTLPAVITNEWFMEWVMGDQWRSGLIAGFAGDPQTDADWRAYPASMLPELAVQRTLNMYFCPSLVRGTRRWTREFVSFHAIVVDDYGTKVAIGHPELVLGMSPNYVIETSPGNFQAGWLLEPARDLAAVKHMLKWLRHTLGAGDNLADPMAWRRLPVGCNGKPQHRSGSGKPWQTELTIGGSVT
jgi:RepB DNA-primase from phage plasmid